MDEKEIFGAMSHLSEDEKRKILDVVKRAQALDEQAASSSRWVEVMSSLLHRSAVVGAGAYITFRIDTILSSKAWSQYQRKVFGGLMKACNSR